METPNLLFLLPLFKNKGSKPNGFVSATSFTIPSSDLAKLNAYLDDRSYLSGFSLSQTDLKVLNDLKSTKIPHTYPNLQRWIKHVESYSQEDLKSIPSLFSYQLEPDLDARVCNGCNALCCLAITFTFFPLTIFT